MEARKRIIQKNNQHSQKIMQFSVAFTFGLVCLLAVSAAPPTAEQMTHMKEMAKKCVTVSGVDPEVLHSLGKGEAVDDENAGCFGACMMQEMGIMDDSGKIDTEAAIAHLPAHLPLEEVKKVIEACAKEQGKTLCETAGLLFQCLHEKKADDWFPM